MTLVSSTPPSPALREPSSAPLEVTLILTPLVGEPGHPPRLTVEAKNLSAQPLPFMRFTSTSCFAHFYLSLRLTPPGGKSLTPSAGCAVLKWPGIELPLAPGAVERRELKLEELFPGLTWEKGRYELDAQWNPTELAAYKNGRFAWNAQMQSYTGPGFNLAPALGPQVRAEKDRPLKLPDGAVLTFKSHSHKRTMVGGPPSPLITYLSFKSPSGPALEDVQVNLQLDETRLFVVGDGYVFELVAHDYNEWMDLRYFGKLSGQRRE